MFQGRNVTSHSTSHIKQFTMHVSIQSCRMCTYNTTGAISYGAEYGLLLSFLLIEVVHKAWTTSALLPRCDPRLASMDYFSKFSTIAINKLSNYICIIMYVYIYTYFKSELYAKSHSYKPACSMA